VGRVASLGTLAVLLAGCGRAPVPVQPTPYQPFNPKQTEGPDGEAAGGYIDAVLQPGVYLVTFRGSTTTLAETVIAYAYRRAAELCGGQGRFDVTNEEDVSKVRAETTSSARAYGSGPWAVARGTSETDETVWPRRRLTVRCKDE
jgi:hypothetical protein